MTTLTAAMRRPVRHLLVQSGLLTMRSVRALIRQPLVRRDHPRPAGHLAAVVRPAVPVGRAHPGFASSQDGSGSYLEFISPGVIMMTVLFSAAWAGTIYIEDMNRGVMDRLLRLAGVARRHDDRHAGLPGDHHPDPDPDRVQDRLCGLEPDTRAAQPESCSPWLRRRCCA